VELEEVEEKGSRLQVLVAFAVRASSVPEDLAAVSGGSPFSSSRLPGEAPDSEFEGLRNAVLVC